jgi:DNA-binding IclR family transcriptional regulator
VFAVLEALSQSASSGLTLSEVAHGLGLSTSTTAAILVTMDEAGYVERLSNRAYRLGPGLLTLLSGLRDRYPLLGAAEEELSRLSAHLGCGCSLARINAADLEVVLTTGNVDEFEARAGQRVPLHPPYGSAAVAWRTPPSIDEWIAGAPDPVTSGQADEMRTRLAEIRQCGYAVYNVKRDARTMVNQIRTLLGAADEHAPGEVLRTVLLSAIVGLRIFTAAELADRRRRPISYVIAPVFGPDEQPRYLLSLHVMRDALSADDLDHCTAALLNTARGLTKLAGGSWPPPFALPRRRSPR